MSLVLVYTDEPLVRQIATGLIGSEVQIGEGQSSQSGINFKVLLTRTKSAHHNTTTKIADLLPEMISEAIHNAISEKIIDLNDARIKLVAGGPAAFAPGTPVLITNCQLSGESIVTDAVLGTEECASYCLRINEFYLRAYIPKKAQGFFMNFLNQPVEVAGILRYTPPYNVPGALSLSLGLRICSLWLR